MTILTNNPLAMNVLKERGFSEVIFVEGTIADVYAAVRDKVHQGYRILTHPLSGSVKPYETLYKSIGISDAPESALHVESLLLIEDAIRVMNSVERRYPVLTPVQETDFQWIDWTLICSSLEHQRLTI